MHSLILSDGQLQDEEFSYVAPLKLRSYGAIQIRLLLLWAKSQEILQQTNITAGSMSRKSNLTTINSSQYLKDAASSEVESLYPIHSLHTNIKQLYLAPTFTILITGICAVKKLNIKMR